MTAQERELYATTHHSTKYKRSRDNYFLVSLAATTFVFQGMMRVVALLSAPVTTCHSFPHQIHIQFHQNIKNTCREIECEFDDRKGIRQVVSSD